MSPRAGDSLVDVFQFRALLWDTDDLPLAYSFNYGRGDSNLSTPVQALSEFSVAYAKLAAFEATEGESVTVVTNVNVVDTIGASASATDSVVVYSSTTDASFNISSFAATWDVNAASIASLYYNIPFNAKLQYLSAVVHMVQSEWAQLNLRRHLSTSAVVTSSACGSSCSGHGSCRYSTYTGQSSASDCSDP
eukprot:gene23828-29318_t